jgi:hypothetical protein
MEIKGEYLVYEEPKVHRTSMIPVKLLAFNEFWWITKRFWKPGLGCDCKTIYQSDAPDGYWEPCQITDRLSREP